MNEHRLLDRRSIEELPTVPLPSFHADQMLSNEPDVLNGESIDEMLTWILPSIEKEHIRGTAKKSNKTIVSGTESQLAPIRSLIKRSGIYAIGSVVSPMVSLVLAPFLTHYLSATDYGILTILNTLITLGAGITQLGQGTALIRAYSYDYTSPRDQRDVLATVTTLLFLISIPAVIGVAILAPFVAILFLGRSSLGNLIVLAGGTMLLQNLTVPGFAWLRAENRALFYALLAISNLLVTLIANLVLVGMLHLGVTGSLIATGSGYASIIICVMPITLLRAGVRMRRDILQNVLTFGVPLILNFISYWVLQLSDRYLLSLFGSLAQTAKYAVAYSLGSAIAVVVMGPFMLAWPTTMFAVAKREDAAQVFRLLFRWFSLFLLFAAFGLTLAGKVLLDWLFPVTYHSVAFVIPIIAVSIVIYGVYYLFAIGVNVKRKTGLLSIYMTVAASVNVILNLILISPYGAMGAAISTLIAYIVLAIIGYVVNQRIYPIPFEIGKFIIALFVGIALYTGSSLVAESRETYVAWGISFAAFCLYGGFLMALGKFLDRDCRA